MSFIFIFIFISILHEHSYLCNSYAHLFASRGFRYGTAAVATLRVLVAAAPTSQHGLGPPAELDPRVRPDNAVAAATHTDRCRGQRFGVLWLGGGGEELGQQAREGHAASCSVAGGSVAGGSVAGGSVAGGNVAGGSVAGGNIHRAEERSVRERAPGRGWGGRGGVEGGGWCGSSNQ